MLKHWMQIVIAKSCRALLMSDYCYRMIQNFSLIIVNETEIDNFTTLTHLLNHLFCDINRYQYDFTEQ